jgi:hypothetical protein
MIFLTPAQVMTLAEESRTHQCLPSEANIVALTIPSTDCSFGSLPSPDFEPASSSHCDFAAST